MGIVIGVIISIVLIIVALATTAARRGYKISLCLQAFDNTYQAAMQRGNPKDDALREAFQALREAPRFDALTDEDINRIVRTMSAVEEPALSIRTIVMKTDSGRAVAMLKDPNFIKQVADIGRRQETRLMQEQSSALMTLTRDSFELAQEFVGFRNRMNKEAGTFLSSFRKIDYEAINMGAIGLETRSLALRDKVRLVAGSDMLLKALHDYAEALSEAVRLTRQKTDLMLQLSRNPAAVSHSEFNSLADEENQALRRCQSTGDSLTSLYRSSM